MKQLKFMLAAATAISLATAAQADLQKNQLFKDTFNTRIQNGEEVAIADKTPATDLGYSFTPAEDESDTDNESIVKAGSGPDSSNALSVNTGKTPILRAIYSTSSAGINLTGVESIYIDTMVQFTVTPNDDDVVATSTDDKLLIYLKEDLANERTNLVVRAAGVKVDENGDFTNEMEEDGVEYIINTEDDIIPNEWYRLVVKAKAIQVGEGGYWPVFNIYLGGDTDEDQLFSEREGGFENLNEAAPIAGGDFVSLQVTENDADGFQNPNGADKLALTSVGFAGEGMVDDLTVGTITTVSAVDFTLLSFDIDDGVDSVTYTIGAEDSVTIKADTTEAIQVKHGTTVAISATAKDWFTLENYSTSYTASADDVAKTIKVVSTKLSSKEDANGTVTVNPNATTEEIAAVKTSAGITGGAFKDVTDATELGKVLTWKNKVSADDFSAVEFEEAAVTNVDGSVENVLVADGAAAEAYLLNCDPASTETLQEAKDNFKFEAKDLANLFDLTFGTEDLQNTIFEDKKYNGSIVLEGKEELSGEWKVRASGHKFFRARLVK